MKTLSVGVIMDEGADFSLVVGIRGINGPTDLTGYSFLGEMRSTTDPLSPIAGGAKATGTYVFTGNPAPMDTITVNSVVITFVTGAPTGNQIQIGQTVQQTLCSLMSFLRCSANANLLLATYTFCGLIITVTFDMVGLAGNAFTLAAASTVITPSAATLLGGLPPAEFVFTIRDQATNKGQVVWSLPQAIVNTIITSISNPLQLKRLKTPYVFDIKMEDTVGTVTRIAEGIIYVSPQATQEIFP